jgi:DoxX-like protein
MDFKPKRGINMASDTEKPRVSKVALWTGRVISALPVLLMVAGAVFSFAKPAAAREGMVKHGYAEHHAVPIVVVELCCVLLYVIPRTAVLGAILLTGYLGGATATHVRVDEAYFMPVVVGILVWLGLYLREPRLRALLPMRR